MTLIYCSGQQPDEHSNSGYALKYLTGADCGSQVFVPGLYSSWETGIAYSFPVLPNLISATITVDTNNGTGVQIFDTTSNQGEFLIHVPFSGEVQFDLTPDHLFTSTELVVFGRGEFLESNSVQLNYADAPSQVPEPATYYIGAYFIALFLILRFMRGASK